MALYALSDIKENSTDYINQYRQSLISALSYLNDFMTTLEHPETLDQQQQRQLLKITEDLARDQQRILAIIDMDPE